MLTYSILTINDSELQVMFGLNINLESVSGRK